MFLLSLGACKTSDSESDAFGNFEATEVLISSEANGKVIQLLVDEGQELNNGEVLAIVDTSQLSIKKSQLKASFAVAQSRIIQIEAQKEVLRAQKGVLMKDVSRVYNMFRDKAATSKQVDDLQGQVHVMDKQLEGFDSQVGSVYAELNVINTQLIEVNDQINRCTITMPSNGTILQKYIEQGEMASIGKPVVKVADLNKMYLRAFISGSQLPNVKIGQEVEVRFDMNEDHNQSIKGSVSWISSNAEFTPKIIQTKEERVDLVYAIKVIIQNDGCVKIGMPGEVKF